MPTRKEAALKKFEKTLTPKQQKLVKEQILKDTVNEAHNIMSDKHDARLYPSVTVMPTAAGIANLMFHYGYHSHQLWGKDDKGEWIMYQYDR